VIAVAIDISEQVKYRQSVEALNEELLATNADLDNFVYAASHDLRAPISNIEGLMLALVDDLPVEVLESGAVKRVLGLMQSSVDRFKRTVTDLSDIAKLQRQAEDDVSYVDFAGTVAEVMLDFERSISESGALIETELAPDAAVHFSAKNMRSIVTTC
jgi:signal transduction histidine kinase